jgi:membrane protein YdbS with pleckstrin-like domain
MAVPRTDEEWRAPSPRLRTMRRVQVGVPTLLVVPAALGIGWSAGGTLAGVVSAVVALLMGAAALWFVERRVRAWGFCERGDDLLVRRGVMVRRLSVVPYGRMQFVDVTAGPVERAFGLATVRMHTAAAASDARIPGLAGAEASRLRDQLATLGESNAAGL